MTAAGHELSALVLDIDAILITCHSEKKAAAPTYKNGFGYHPLLCFLANTGEGMSGLLRPGSAGANTAADHITVLDQALAQIPDAHRHGTAILVRADSAGSAKAFLAHLDTLRENGLDLCFSFGHAVTEPVRRAIGALPDKLWHPALDQNGTLRDGAEVAELTGILPPFRDQRRLARAVPGAIDLLAWTRVLLLDGELAAAEPKKLRYRILHVAARLTHGGRRLRLRICSTWPWKPELATAFHRLAALPRPAG